MNEEFARPEEGPTLLFIEPRQPPSNWPIVDDLTRQLVTAYRLSQPSHLIYFGFHECSCGALSDNTDHYLSDGTKTNSLCIHYMAYHRHEVPESALEFVRRLSGDGAEPTTDELHRPPEIGRPAPGRSIGFESSMKKVRHLMRSVFDRYNITSEEDLRDAMHQATQYVARLPVTR
jgi:hypothetical protein